MKIANSEEIAAWLFEHGNLQGHICDGIKGRLQGANTEDNLVNIAFVDRETNERIEIIYE